mgnify:CR=1 FL=1
MKTTQHHREGRAGFSLLEIVIAMAILGFGVMAVLQLFPRALQQTRQAAEQSTVASLARTELGKMRAAGVGNQLVTWAAQNAMNQLTAQQRAYAMYDSWNASVQRVGGDVDLYRVTFSVTLNSGREERFVTYVTRQ